MSASKIRLAYERHQERQRCLDLSSQLLELITHIQQHRGATLAILGGDEFFETRLAAIKPRVLESLQGVQQLRGNFLNNHTWENLCAEWFTVNYHWRQDNAFHNFELHTHLIQQLLRAFKDFNDSEMFQNLDKSNTSLAKLALCDFPELMETGAQIRGIGTHCLASGNRDKVFVDRLGYLCRYFSRSTEHLDAIHDMDSLLLDIEPWKDVQIRWSQVEKHISEDFQGKGELSADTFFNDLSLLVFQTKLCTKLCFKQLRSTTDNDLDQWIRHSSYRTTKSAH